MDLKSSTTCLRCSLNVGATWPFCPECGEPSPGMPTKGTFAVELGEVASANIRENAVRLLRGWFPGLDPLETDARLAKGGYWLVDFVDEASAGRIISALKNLHADARMVKTDSRNDWWRLLGNMGLAGTVAALLLAALLTGFWSALFLFLGLAAPVGVAARRRNKLKPMVPAVNIYGNAEEWMELADRFSQVIGRLGNEDRQALMALMREIFGLAYHLERDSLASIAAGKESGDLYLQLMKAANAAVTLSRGIADGPPDSAVDSRKEINALSTLVQETGRWFVGRDKEPAEPRTDLASEFEQVKENIDRILGDIRAPGQTAAHVEGFKREETS